MSNASSTFTPSKKKTNITIEVVSENHFKDWIKKQEKPLVNKAKEVGFEGKAGQIVVDRDDTGKAKRIYAGLSEDASYFDFADIHQVLSQKLSKDTLNTASFEFTGLGKTLEHKAYIGWGWASYGFETYKTEKTDSPVLVWSKSVNKEEVLSFIDAVNLLRDLINTPANDMGPEEIEKAVKALAKPYKAKVTVIKDKDKVEKDFPLVFTVGKGSPRRPRLIDMVWGNAKNPKVTLVGKGVAFDTGGLDIKPSEHMRYMKKDMGGAAHTMALAKLIMDHKLPVRLRLIIPAVENAVAGESFRPGDIIKSRKGIFVENTNTDAEGRLILADALAYACEDKPELVIDYATLTGSARAGLGPDIPALFSNNEKIADSIQKGSLKAEDPVWAMPLWQPYRKHIENSVGDIVNSAGLPGDLIYSALFLESFVEKNTDWVHLDCYAWEYSGRAGRPKGAADTGLRAVFAYLQKRYG